MQMQAMQHQFTKQKEMHSICVHLLFSKGFLKLSLIGNYSLIEYLRVPQEGWTEFRVLDFFLKKKFIVTMLSGRVVVVSLPFLLHNGIFFSGTATSGNVIYSI